MGDVTQRAGRREGSQAVRRRLIEAAVAQLAQEGMRGLTHRKVERRAGVSQGLAKYHFGNLAGLIEAVLTHMVEVELPDVFSVSPQTQAAALASGEFPPELWHAARAVLDGVAARPDLVRARFELYLHAAGRPELQEIIRRARNKFVRMIAASLPSANPEAAARMVVALIDGMLLDQLSAPEPLVEAMGPAYLLYGGAAALQLPAPATPRSTDSVVPRDETP